MEPMTNPQPPTFPAEFAPKKPPKLLYIFGGVAIILVTLALGISFFGKAKISTNSKTVVGEKGKNTPASSIVYKNTDFFYEFTLPQNWVEIKHSPLFSATGFFNANNLANLEIFVGQTTLSLDEYLTSQDDSYKASIKVTKTTPVKVAQYDGYEREESFTQQGIQTLTTYFKIKDNIYIFTLTPAPGQTAINTSAM